MKQFDMTRFGRVLKLDFYEGRKAMMWGTLCMLLLYLFFFWFAHELGFHIKLIHLIMLLMVLFFTYIHADRNP